LAAAIETKPYKSIIKNFDSNLDDFAPIASQCKEHIELSNCWITSLISTESGEAPEKLLHAANASAVEAITFIALGLLRPAVLSLRSYYELTLMFTYYQSHPIEWNSAKSFRTDHKLPKAIQTYLATNYPHYKKRWDELKNRKQRDSDNCYAVLSSVAHGSAMNSLPSAKNPKELIASKETLSQAPRIFYETAEMVSDIYISCSEMNWISLPKNAKDNIKERFGDHDAKKLLLFE